MVDFHKVDPDVAKAADKLLHMDNQHAVADFMDHTKLDPVALIKEMESQSKHLHQDFPKVVIDGVSEHLVHEASRGQEISGEYNALSAPDKVAAAKSFEQQKSGKMTVHETPDGKLGSVEVETSPGVLKSVYAPDAGKKSDIQTKIKEHIPGLPH